MCFEGTREITRLDITMHLLHFLTLTNHWFLILIFLNGSEISFEKVVVLGSKTKIVFLLNRFFCQKFTRNPKICWFVSKCNFYHLTFVALIQDLKPYIQPSNLFSVLWVSFTMYLPQVALQFDHVDHCISHGLVLQFSLLFDGPSHSFGRIPCWIKERLVKEKPKRHFLSWSTSNTLFNKDWMDTAPNKLHWAKSNLICFCMGH